MDLAAARAALIDSQVRTNDVHDRRVLAALSATPRELFVPEAKRGLAYAEQAVESCPGRWLWLARDFAKLVNAADILETDRVLDIAPGTGYSTAVLARLAAKVTVLEERESFADTALKTATQAGVSNIEMAHGSLKAGLAAKGPYDVIFVGGAVEDVPAAWIDQLAEGGRLAVVVTEGAVRRAKIFTKSGGRTAGRIVFDSNAPSLAGFEKAEAFRL